jgi:Na+-driven multidrug efflux pump
MSTIDGYAFLSAITVGKDLLWKRYGQGKENLATRFSQLGLVLTFIAAVSIALWSQSVVDIWYQLGSLATPALLLPLASSFSEKWKMPARAAFFSMFISAALSGCGC